MIRRDALILKDERDMARKRASALRAVGVEPLVDPGPALDLTASAARAPGGRGRDYRMRRLLVGADVLALALAIASWSLLGIPHSAAHILWASLTLPLWIVLFT